MVETRFVCRKCRMSTDRGEKGKSSISTSTGTIGFKVATPAGGVSMITPTMPRHDIHPGQQIPRHIRAAAEAQAMKAVIREFLAGAILLPFILIVAAIDFLIR